MPHDVVYLFWCLNSHQPSMADLVVSIVEPLKAFIDDTEHVRQVDSCLISSLLQFFQDQGSIPRSETDDAVLCLVVQ